jgi:hypothetical protein
MTESGKSGLEVLPGWPKHCLLSRKVFSKKGPQWAIEEVKVLR